MKVIYGTTDFIGGENSRIVNGATATEERRKKEKKGQKSFRCIGHARSYGVTESRYVRRRDLRMSHAPRFDVTESMWHHRCHRGRAQPLYKSR
jgi:hypothetical protein